MLKYKVKLYKSNLLPKEEMGIVVKERKVNKITKDYIVSLFEDMRYNNYDNYRLGFEGDYFGWVSPNQMVSRFLLNEKMDWDLQEMVRNCDENRDVVSSRTKFVELVYARTRGIVPKQQPTLTKPQVVKPRTKVVSPTPTVVTPAPKVQPKPSVVNPTPVTKPTYKAPVPPVKPVVNKPTEPTLTKVEDVKYPEGLKVSFEEFLKFYNTLLYKGTSVDEKMLRHFYDKGSSERLIVGLLQESYKKVESPYTIAFIEKAFTPEAIRRSKLGADGYLKKMYFSVRKDFLLKRIVDFKNYFDKINLF